MLQAAWASALDFGGPLGAAGAAALVCDLTEMHTGSLAAALPALRSDDGSAAEVVETEGAHDALTLLRAVHTLRERMLRAEAAFDEALRQVRSPRLLLPRPSTPFH